MGPRDLLIRKSMDDLTDEQLAEYEQAKGTQAANKLKAEPQMGTSAR